MLPKGFITHNDSRTICASILCGCVVFVVQACCYAQHASQSALLNARPASTFYLGVHAYKLEYASTGSC